MQVAVLVGATAWLVRASLGGDGRIDTVRIAVFAVTLIVVEFSAFWPNGEDGATFVFTTLFWCGAVLTLPSQDFAVLALVVIPLQAVLVPANDSLQTMVLALPFGLLSKSLLMTLTMVMSQGASLWLLGGIAGVAMPFVENLVITTMMWLARGRGFGWRASVCEFLALDAMDAVVAGSLAAPMAIVALDAPAAPLAFAAPVVAVSLLSAVTARARRMEHELGEAVIAAGTDPMTGLMNRRGLGEWVDSIGSDAAVLCVIALDADGLKRVNDEFGHDFGDRAIVEIGQSLVQATIPIERSAVARLGGDEFVIVLVDAGVQVALDVAAVARADVATRVSSFGMSISAGVAEFPIDGPSAHEVVALATTMADRALYAAKRSGRDTIRIWDGQAGTSYPASDDVHLDGRRDAA